VVIYLVTNTVNGKIYVGKTVETMDRRWTKHMTSAKRRSNYPFHRAIRKYGTSAFTLQVIATAETDEQLRELEIYWIRELRSNDPAIGYNMTKGGDGPAGWVMSEATKKKIRLKALGRPCPKSTRDAVSRRHKGVPISAEHKRKIAAHWDLDRRDAQGEVARRVNAIENAKLKDYTCDLCGETFTQVKKGVWGGHRKACVTRHKKKGPTPKSEAVL
jgi:group I intron endonuclease